MTIYRFEPGPILPKDLVSLRTRTKEPDNVLYTGSGKAAIVLILEHLKSTHVLPTKMTSVLMPRWLGTWVYAQTLGYCFPTLDAHANSPVVFVYHQYGFPQNMDKVMSIAADRRMTVIEDCAHAVDSTYQGKKLGDFGDYALFSYSKFAFCYALGSVVAKDDQFPSFAKVRMRGQSRLKRSGINFFKLCDEWHNDRKRLPFRVFFDGLRNMAYSRYGEQSLASERAIFLWETKRADECAARRENYGRLRSVCNRYGVCDHLEQSGVTPYAVPLDVQGERADALVRRLNQENIRAGIYQFDFNRCVYEPDFRPCVLVPIHSGLLGSGLDKMIQIVKSVL